MSAMQQNPDGSWSETQPLGWQGGYDWEVYRNITPMRADLFDEDVLMATVEGKTMRKLVKAMRREQNRLGITTATLL